MPANPAVRSVLAPISVVIPTYNRCALLEETLECCVAHAGGVDLEFVVIDDGSTDDSVAMLQRRQQRYPNLVWRSVPNRGPGQARNLGASIAKYDVILFLGDDIQPLNDDFFRIHSQLHGTHPSDRFAVLGKVVWPNTPDAPVTFIMAHVQGHGGEQFGYADLTPRTFLDWRFFYTCNISVKKTIVSNWLTGGFSARFALAAFEDGEFAYRMARQPGGFEIFYEPLSIGAHVHRYSADNFISRQLSAGMMANVLVELHPELAETLGLAPLVNALNSPLGPDHEQLAADYLAVIEGVKSWARIQESKNTLGRDAWHDDLLFAVFELAFLQGFVIAQSNGSANFSAAYDHILSRCVTRLQKIVHTELVGHESIKSRLLGLQASNQTGSILRRLLRKLHLRRYSLPW